MYAKGHAGLTLFIMSLVMLPFGYNVNAITIIILATGLSALPDIDLEWRNSLSFVHHRGVTHSIAFAIVTGLVFGGMFFYSQKTILWFEVGFLSGFLGVMCHLLGDIFTHHAFKPLWPFSQKEVALHWTNASNKSVNDGLGSLGTITFTLYMLYTLGALQDLLNIFT